MDGPGIEPRTSGSRVRQDTDFAMQPGWCMLSPYGYINAVNSVDPDQTALQKERFSLCITVNKDKISQATIFIRL